LIETQNKSKIIILQYFVETAAVLLWAG